MVGARAGAALGVIGARGFIGDIGWIVDGRVLGAGVDANGIVCEPEFDAGPEVEANGTVCEPEADVDVDEGARVGFAVGF